MMLNTSRILRVILAILLASLLVVIAVPSLSAATRAPSPSPSPRTLPGGKTSPSPTATLLPLTAVYADTNVPQISNITSSTETIDSDFVVSVAIDVRIHRNTISSLSIGLAQKTAQGAYVDPIFQAPCAKLGNLSVSSLNSAGDSTALQSRAADGDWYIERYVITSKTKLGTNLVPCLGQYLITSVAIVDAAKHTLNVVANLAATLPVVASNSSASPGPTRASTPQASTAKNNDTAIMTSNIWNSRIDLAPCTAGTNQLPTITTQKVGTTNVTVTTPPTIVPTNRIACAPTVNYDFTKPLVTILASNDSTGLSPIAAVGTGGGLPIFDYAAAHQNNDIEALKKEIEDLKQKNAKLTSDLAKYKKTKASKKKPTPNSSPSAQRRSSNSNGQGQPNWSGTPGGNGYQQNWSRTPGVSGQNPKSKSSPTRRSTPSPTGK